MRSGSFTFPIKTLALILVAGFLCGGCTGVWAPPQYKGPGGQITADMVPVKNEAMKLDFLLPKGWTAVV